MDALNKWFEDFTTTPAGSILLFALVFLMRVGVDEWQRRKARKRQDKTRRKAA